jgi:hypothetical protein
MSITSTVLAACAFWMWTGVPAQLHPTATLTVHINLEFDAAIRSKTIKTIARNEAAAIWSAYGVELQWSESDCGAVLDLDVIVGRHEPGVVLDGSPSVLGTTTVDRSGVVRAPIHISIDTIEYLLLHRTGELPVLRDQELGRALGRVLAHELGHVLLGPNHDSKGLMRARLTTEDLARYDRRGVRLSDVSVSRLRSQIAHLSDAQRSVGENEHRTCDPDDAPAWEREAPAPLGSTARLVRSTRLRQTSGEAGDCQ